MTRTGWLSSGDFSRGDLNGPQGEMSCNVNVEFKVTLHKQVRYRGTLQYEKLQSVTQCVIRTEVYVAKATESTMVTS